MLVENGLARAHGKTRENPDGMASEMVLQKLRDLETAAILRRAGIWQESDPDQIRQVACAAATGRTGTGSVRESIVGTRTLEDEPLNPNTATSEQLQSIKGIGPVLAGKIISGRPYNSVDELLQVHGIGPKP